MLFSWVDLHQKFIGLNCFIFFLEGTSALTAPVPSHLVIKLTNDTIKMKDWSKLRILYLGGGGTTSQPLGGGGLATNIKTPSVPLGEVIRHFGQSHSQPASQQSSFGQNLLISTLLEHGASANVVEGFDAIPLDEAMRQENLPLVEKLIHNGANSCAASSDGEPMIHKALRKGLISGNFIESCFCINRK